MKIVVFEELPFGGALRATHALTLELAKHHQVTLVSVGGDVQKDRKTIHPKSQQNLTVLKFNFISMEKTKGIRGRITHDFLDLVRLYRLHRQIAARIEALGVDVCLVQPSKYTQAPFVLRFLKTKTIYYAQEPLRLVYDSKIASLSGLSLVSKIYESMNREWRKRIDFINQSGAHRLVTNSKFTARWLKQSYSRDAKVCYLGVDVNFFKPIKKKKIYDVLFIGAPVTIEGYDLLMSASKLAKKPWKIRVISRSVTGGEVTDEELVSIINESKVYVSLSHADPFGLGVLETGACKVPSVVANDGAYPESVLQGVTGYLVDRQPKKLAQAIDKLLVNTKLRTQLGINSYHRVHKAWTWEASGKRLMKILSDF